jgi:hypothetical protein
MSDPSGHPSTAVGKLVRAPSAAQLMQTPQALLTRSHLRDLGLGRSAIDAIFRQLPVIVFPGSSRPHIRADDYLTLVQQSTYDDTRVRLTRR